MRQIRIVHRLGALAMVFGLACAGYGMQPESVNDWSKQVWTSARAGDEHSVDTLLSEFNTKPASKALESLHALTTHYENDVAKREADRQTRIAEVRKELAEKIEEMEDDPYGFKTSEAMGLSSELIELNGGSVEAAELLSDPLIAKVIKKADVMAREAEADGHWLEASELFYRLDVLFDIDRRYKADVDRQSQRLAMIRLYTPEHFWEMRNARRVANGDPELPPYNPIGDTWQEKLDGIDEWLVTKSVEVSGTRHVDGVAIKEELLAGIDGVRTLAMTTELGEAFAGLADATKRQAFLARLDAQRQDIEQLEKPVNPRLVRGAVKAVLDASDETVQVAHEALLHAYGNGALSALDDYSVIIWPDEVRRFQRNTRGEFVGIGVQIQYDELMRIKIVTPLEGTPAQRAGVHADDIIIKVNGESTAGFTLDQAVDVITGPKNTKVTITVEREVDGQKIEKDFELIRKPIKLRSVKGWKRLGANEDDWDWFVDHDSGIGYVRLTQFTENTSSDLIRAVAQMRKEGLKGLVLDLRFNPGGLLDQAVAVVGEFVPNGVVVTTENADGQRTGVEKTSPNGGELADIPLAILVNQGSASASEIVSGALQDYANWGKIDAIVIGKRSFGKGSVQNAWPLPTRAQTILKVTTQYYRLPGGRLIHRRPGMTDWGIDPDYVVDMLPKQNADAIALRRDADVLPLDENGNIVVSEDKPLANPDDLLTKGIDLQLEAAIVLLKSRTIEVPAVQGVIGAADPEPEETVGSAG